MSEEIPEAASQLGHLVRRGGAARLFGASVFDQAMLSAANFVIGLLLIRYTSDTDYGVFVLVQSALLLLVTAHSAYVCNPLAVLAPQRPEADRLLMIGSVDHSLSRLLRWLLLGGLVLTLLIWFLGLVDNTLAAVVVAGLAAGWFALRRDLLRAVALIHGKPQQILYADFFYVGIAITAAVAAAQGLEPATFWAVMGLALGGFAFNVVLRRWLGQHFPAPVAAARSYWREMHPFGKWAVIGATLFWLSAQGFNYVLAAKLDATAVAFANAVRIFTMPVTLLMIGTRGVLLPMASRWVAEVGVATATRRISAIGGVLLLLGALYFLPLWFVRDWMMQTVLRKDITHFDALLLCWGATAVLGIVRDTYITLLLSCGRHKQLAFTGGSSSLLAFAAVWVGVDAFGVIGAVYGLILGDVCYLAMILVLLARELRSKTPPPTVAP